MFVSFYAFYYGLFSLRAVSSADLPSLGEGLCQKPFSCLTRVTPLCKDVEYALWSLLAPPMKMTGAVLSSLPVNHATAVVLLTFSEHFSVRALHD